MATITPVASAVPGVFPFSMRAQQSIVVDPKSPGSINSPHGLILFDGVCVLCSRGCGFVSKCDRRLVFALMRRLIVRGFVEVDGRRHLCICADVLKLRRGQRDQERSAMALHWHRLQLVSASRENQL